MIEGSSTINGELSELGSRMGLGEGCRENDSEIVQVRKKHTRPSGRLNGSVGSSLVK